MDQETIIQQEGLGEVINRVKDLIARVDTQIGCASAVPERSGDAEG